MTFFCSSIFVWVNSICRLIFHPCAFIFNVHFHKNASLQLSLYRKGKLNKNVRSDKSAAVGNPTAAFLSLYQISTLVTK